MAGVAAVIGNSHKALAPDIVLDVAGGTLAARNSTGGDLVHLRALVGSSGASSAQIWTDDLFAHSSLKKRNCCQVRRRDQTSRFRKAAEIAARSA